MNMKLASIAIYVLAPLNVVFSQEPANTVNAGVDTALRQVAEFHGAAGVFAVAGYRMGEHALRELKEPRGSFNLDVTHETPLEVQYSCIADGWQAATGVSAGKLNLHLIQVPAQDLKTTVKDRKTGEELIFYLQPAFLKKYLNLPHDKQPAAAREVATMPEEEIFTVRKMQTPLLKERDSQH
jgi:formylmethanofuran dehydrogenase subunit E